MLNPWEAFFFWLGAGLALWQVAAAARLSPADSVDGRDAPAGCAGPRLLKPPTQVAHDLPQPRRSTLLLGRRRVGGVSDFLRERLPRMRTGDQGRHRRGECNRHRPADARDDHAPNLLLTSGRMSPRCMRSTMAAVMEMMEAQEANISTPGVVYLLPEIHGDHGLRYLYDRPPFHISAMQPSPTCRKRSNQRAGRAVMNFRS